MTNIKKVWLNPIGRGLHNLCIRFNQHTGTKRLILTQSELPPLGPEKMNLPDAQAHGLSEDHCVLGVLDEDDLIALHNAIGEHLGTDP